MVKQQLEQDSMSRNDLLHKCPCDGISRLVLGRKDFWLLRQIVHENLLPRLEMGRAVHAPLPDGMVLLQGLVTYVCGFTAWPTCLVSHFGPPVVLGQLAMYVGLSKPTIVKQSLSVHSSRDDLQSLGLLQVVQTVVDDLELEASENYLPSPFFILW